MSRSLVITVVTRGDDLEQHVPLGFQYVDQIFEEAGLRDSVSVGQLDSFWVRLRIMRRTLRREFGEQVKLRVLSPWTPEGLWAIIRYRVREYPCLIISGQRYAPDLPLETLVEAVGRALSGQSME